MIERISYLSQEIGPRPAGTEEEQQAANYIAESFENEIGLPAEIQEFNAPSDGGTLRAILAGVTVVASILALLVGVLAVPLFLLLVVVAVVFFLEETGKPIISRFLSRGVSQNVVAKYVPDTLFEGRRRRRKVILVARYDSGKVCKELDAPFVGLLPILNKISAGAMFFMPVLVLLRLTLFAHAGGVLAVILNLLTILGLLAVALPLATKLMRRFAAYNEAANSNAAGVAVMMEAARRMASGTAAPQEKASDDEFEPVVHGEQAAREEGVVPADVPLTYQVSASEPQEQQDENQPAAAPAPADVDDAQAAAKAAVAAMMARAMETVTEPAPVEAVAEAAEVATAAVAAPAPVIPEPEQDNTPSWWKSAQAKARKNTEAEPVVHRSRYADVLDSAVTSNQAVMEEAAQATEAMSEQLEKLDSSISFVEPPAEAIAQAEAEAAAAVEAAAVIEAAAVSPVEESASAPAAFEPAVEPAVAVAAEAAPAAEVAPEPVVEPEAPVQIPEPEPLPGTVDPAEQFAGFSASLDQIKPDLDVAIPSFLDPANAQREAQEQQSARSDERSTVAAGQEMDDALAADSVQAAPLSSVDVAPHMQEAEAAKPARPRMTLPSLSGEISAIKDRGGLLAALPSINVTPSAEKAAAPRPSVRDLQAAVPSLSGEISKIKGQVASLTGPLKPVEDVYADDEPKVESPAVQEPMDDTPQALQELDLPLEPLEQAEGQEFADVYDDYDDVDPYQELIDSEEPLEMEPEPKAKGFFANLMSRFSHKPKRQEPEYFDEEDAWADDQAYGQPYDQAYDVVDDQPVDQAYDAYEGDREWKGGAFSLKDKIQSALPQKGAGLKVPGRRRKDDVYADAEPEEAPLADAQELPEGAEPVEQAPEAPEEHIEAIREFHNPYIGTEVWFVALGAELADNAGMNAFLAEHGSDLRGSIIVELDALGAGELSYVESGGTLKTVKCSSRMKRAIRKATQISGVPVKTVERSAAPSTTVFANSHGLTAMHLCGMEKGKPALLGQADDVVENVNEEILFENADFVMDLVSCI
ncbi:MAG: hypothetical protein Q4D06_09780 [Coriobacteriia bacterium]|nr:hypothetical protein [Coriobacteriia bacterium]